MENDIFHRPAVSGLLRERYVEARLHIDDNQHPEAVQRTLKLQDELAGARATPYYLVLDPKTRQILARYEGPDLLSGGKKFAEFLDKALH